MSRSLLVLQNCQIKSAEKFRKVCEAIDTLEVETFIGSGRLAFTNVFICPDIDLVPFWESDKPTERLVARVAICLHCKKYGKRSSPRYLAIFKTIEPRFKFHAK